MANENEITGTLLFLDDIRVPSDCAKYMHTKGVDCRIYHKEWVIVRSYNEFIEHIKANGLPEYISYDHDLGKGVETESRAKGMSKKESRQLKQQEKTGMDCAKWLVEYCLDNNKPMPPFAVHSSNPAGAANIQSLLDCFIKNVL